MRAAFGGISFGIIVIRPASFRRFGWLWLPILLVLLARAAVAPGWMVERGAGGVLTVRVCSDIANVGRTIDIPFERGDGHSPDDQQHCGWGALASAPPLESPALPLRIGAPLSPSPLPLSATGFAPGIASPLPPSTGPPTFA